MRQPNYKQDRERADSFEPQVLEILHELMPHLVVLYVASEEEDQKQATDFVVKMKGGQIAVRLRWTHNEEGKEICPWRQLTLRSRRESGKKTELAKIKEGYGYRYFYGWIDKHGVIAEWILVNIPRMRESGLLDKPRPEIPNKEPSGERTYFIPIDIDELVNAGCLIESQLIKKPRTRRKINPQASLDQGIERAKNKKYYNPNIKQQSLWNEK